MSLPAIQGRLFMVVLFTATTCILAVMLAWLFDDPKDKFNVFLAMLGITGLIAKYYFERKDRETSTTETLTRTQSAADQPPNSSAGGEQ